MLSKIKPSLPYFTPDKRQCLILGNINYRDSIAWDDLEAVEQDMEVFSRNIQRYGFDGDFDIIKKTNLTWVEAKKIFNTLQGRIN